MKKFLLLVLTIVCFDVNSQSCATGGCSLADTNSTGQYPAATFSTTSSSWQTVSQYMNGGNYTIFDVTNGDTYEWTYCSDFGGSMGWNAELTLFNNTTGTKLCYNDNCSRSGCPTAPYIQWTANYTGKVKLLTTVSGCTVNTGSPYAKLVWRDTSGTPLTQVLGIDVYSGNAPINWSQVKGAGYTFAWAKATEGVGYTDSQYATFTANGISAGMKMGAYHFWRGDLNPSTTTGATNEANWFLSVAQADIVSCQLLPALDIEGSYIQSNFTGAQLTAWIQTWMNVVQNATGVKPVLYISPTNSGYVQSSLNTYPLWVDVVDGSSTTPPPNIGVWNYWSFKQYDWNGTVPGAGTGQDLNVFNGNMAAFNTLINCSTTGLNQNNIENVFAVYPNPTIENFQINYPSTLGKAFVTVFDVDGREIIGQTISGLTTFDTHSLSAGVYNVSISCEQYRIHKRLVVSK
jgi:GH25 family lysozyme M1 (1,4-beta-N-acetylmuramidase)